MLTANYLAKKMANISRFDDGVLIQEKEAVNLVGINSLFDVNINILKMILSYEKVFMEPKHGLKVWDCLLKIN